MTGARRVARGAKCGGPHGRVALAHTRGRQQVRRQNAHRFGACDPRCRWRMCAGPLPPALSARKDGRRGGGRFPIDGRGARNARGPSIRPTEVSLPGLDTSPPPPPRPRTCPGAGSLRRPNLGARPSCTARNARRCLHRPPSLRCRPTKHLESRASRTRKPPAVRFLSSASMPRPCRRALPALYCDTLEPTSSLTLSLIHI